MEDLETIKGKVLIDADRYEELIKLEAKVESLATFLQSEMFANVDTVLILLGFHIPKRREKRYEEVMELDVEL